MTLAAELVYHRKILEGSDFGRGVRVTIRWRPDGSSETWVIDAEVRPNAVWKRGRLFLRCPTCQRRATRVYVPVPDQEPRCRRCWGLSYQSQTWTYKTSGFLAAVLGPEAAAALGSAAAATTRIRRKERRDAARARYTERRSFLRSPDAMYRLPGATERRTFTIEH